MNRTKKWLLASAFVILGAAGIAAGTGMVPGGTGGGYICDSETGKCECTGMADCYDLGRSRECQEKTLSCTGNKCTCTWR